LLDAWQGNHHFGREAFLASTAGRDQGAILFGFLTWHELSLRLTVARTI
jgi:hypothetical protein